MSNTDMMRYWTFTISRLIAKNGKRVRVFDASKIVHADDRDAAMRLAQEKADSYNRSEQAVVESVSPYSAGR